jgi:hypothetical protein
MTTFRTIDDVKRANAAAGLRWFETDTMSCGCESGSCYCDTIDRDWNAYEDSRP